MRGALRTIPHAPGSLCCAARRAGRSSLRRQATPAGAASAVTASPVARPDRLMSATVAAAERWPAIGEKGRAWAEACAFVQMAKVATGAEAGKVGA